MFRLIAILIGMATIGCSNSNQEEPDQTKNQSKQVTQIKRRSILAKKDSKSFVGIQDGSKESTASDSEEDQKKSGELTEHKDGQTEVNKTVPVPIQTDARETKSGVAAEETIQPSKNRSSSDEQKVGGAREFTAEELKRIEIENQPLPPGRERLQKHLDFATKGDSLIHFHFSQNPKIYSPILLEMVDEKKGKPTELALVVYLIGEISNPYNDAPDETKTAHVAVLQKLVASKDADPVVRLSALIHLCRNFNENEAAVRKKLIVDNSELILESFFKGYHPIFRQNTLWLLTQLNQFEADKVTDVLPRLVRSVSNSGETLDMHSTLVLYLPDITTDRFDYVIGELVKAVNNESLAFHKWDIVESIGKFKCEYEIKSKALISILENHKNGSVRGVAAKTIAKLLEERENNLSDSDKLVQIILKELSREDKERIWGIFVEALGSVHKKAASKAIPNMIKMLQTGDDYRSVCLNVLAKLKGEAKDAAPVIIDGLETWDASYHRDALFALQQIGHGAKEFARRLPKILQKSNETQNIFYTLGLYGPDAADAMPTVVAYLSKPPTAENEREYISAIAAFSKLGKADKANLSLLNKIKDASDPAYTTDIKERAHQAILKMQNNPE